MVRLSGVSEKPPFHVITPEELVGPSQTYVEAFGKSSDVGLYNKARSEAGLKRLYAPDVTLGFGDYSDALLQRLEGKWIMVYVFCLPPEDWRSA